METQTKVIKVNGRKVKDCDCYLRLQSVRGFFDIKPHLLLHRAAGFVVSSKELSKLSRLLRQKRSIKPEGSSFQVIGLTQWSRSQGKKWLYPLKVWSFRQNYRRAELRNYSRQNKKKTLPPLDLRGITIQMKQPSYIYTTVTQWI